MLLAEEDARQLAAASPASFAHIASRGRWVPFEHLILLNDYLLALFEGELDRLLVNMPPRHGKSELVSRHFPAWWLGRRPDSEVIMLSYSDDLISGHSRVARDLLIEHGPQVFGVTVDPAQSGATGWGMLHHKGVVQAAPLGGQITGYGANLLLIDDPFKDEKDAASLLKRDTVWDRFQATASTRLMSKMLGGSVIVVVQTRWHEDDLTGRLLNTGENWTHVNLPALAEPDDLLKRPEGDALCPELFDEQHFTRLLRGGMTRYFFNAIYQQRPTAPEGFMFKRDDFRYWSMEVETAAINTTRWLLLRREDDDTDRRIDFDACPVMQVADIAISSKDTADWTVVGTFRVTPSGELILIDVKRRHFEDQQTLRFLQECSNEHGRPPMYVERFGAGRSPLANLQRAGYPVMEIPEEAGTKLDKVTRAWGAIGQYQAHRVWHPDALRRTGSWLEDFESELLSFNKGAHDDQVDVMSYAARLAPILGVVQEVHEPLRVSQFAGIRSRRF